MAEVLQSLGLSRMRALEPKAKILLVDDNPANLLSLRALLDELGQTLVESCSGEEAIERVKVDEFAVILLDVLMPGINGFETAKAIRGQKRSEHTPVIFLTAGDTDRSQLEEGYTLGAVDFLVKPILPVALQAKVRGFVQLFQDNQRTKQEADQLRLLVEGANDYAIFRLDPQGHVASWNAGAERVKQYRADEIIGQFFSRFYPQDAIERGLPTQGLTVAKAEGRFEDEGWRVRKDGTQFWANVVITALFDEAGTFRGFSKLTRDLTERKTSEENVRRLAEEATARHAAEENTRLIQEQRERLHVTLASIGDAVISTDAEGRVEFLNPVAQELVGWNNEEAAGHPLSDVFRIINAATRQPVENPALRALKEGVVVGLANHTVLIAKDGKEHPIDDSAAPIRDADGNVVGSVLVFRDVTEQRLAAQVSLRNQELLQLIHKIGKIGHWEWNSLTDENRWSPEIEALYGLPPGGFEGGYQGWAKLLHPNDLPKAEEDVRRAMETGEYFSEFRVIWPDGSVHWLETRARVFKDNHDQPVRIMGVNMDITERKLQEAALQESEQRFRGLMEQAPFSVQVLTPTGSTVRVNQAWEKLWGITLDQIADYNILEDSQLKTKGVATFLRRAFAGEPVAIPAIEYNPNETLPDRTRHEDPCRWVSAVAYPLKDDSGTVREVVLVHNDITARKRAEERRQESEHRTRSVLESITDAFFAVDCDWRFSYVNPQAERLLDRKPGDLLGQVIWEVYPGLIESEFEKAYRRVATERITLSLTSFYPDHDRWYEVHVYPAPDGGISIYFQDVSERKRAEAEVDRLREVSEQQRRVYETALSNSADFNYVFDLEGRFLYVNQALLTLWGKQLHEAVGKNFSELDYPHELAERLQSEIKEVITTKQSVRGETPYSSAVSERQYEYIFVPVLGGSGMVEAVAGSTRDITDRKLTEEKLRDSEQRFRQLADAMPQIVWTARPDGEIDYYNRRWYEFTGLPEATGNDGWRQILHPDDAGSAAESWADSLRSGARFEREVRLLDRRQQSYRWHLIRTVAVHDDTGAIAHWFGTSTDIDGQKRAEESSRFLAEASAALAGVVDYESTLQKVANLAVPYFADWSAVDVVNDDGTLRRLAVAHQDAQKIDLAHQLMSQYPPDPHSPGGALAVIRTGKPEIVGEITDEMLVQGTKDERHLRLIRSLGLRSYICVPLVVSGDPLGVLTFATAESGRTYTDADLALANDLANRAGVAIENFQLYQALRDTDRRKDEFLATLAHELRNLLAPIRNSLQILKMPRVDAETVERSREMMERQVHHLVRLVDDLLDVSRVMRGKIELRKEFIELATIVARAVETVQPLVEAQGHNLSVRLPNESLLLDADPVRLTQVVGNLLTNAAKYTDVNGRMWLIADREGDVVVLKVRDNGIGIAPTMLPRIFDLFVQVDHASTKAQGGLGIGLTLVKNLVQMHDGTIEARSAGLGQGSEFVVRLPLSLTRHEQVYDRGTDQQPQQPLSLSGLRLLIVDDNQDAANTLAMLLKLQGHEVRVAHNGPAALDITKDYTPDVVFLDIGMPGMDGYEVARRLRQQPGLKNVVLAALTGWGQKEDRRRTAEAGFNHHLVKPPEPKAVEDVLAGLKRTEAR